MRGYLCLRFTKTLQALNNVRLESNDKKPNSFVESVQFENNQSVSQNDSDFTNSVNKSDASENKDLMVFNGKRKPVLKKNSVLSKFFGKDKVPVSKLKNEPVGANYKTLKKVSFFIMICS